MVVLGIPHADDVVRGEAQLLQHGGKAGRLVHARREHHHGTFIEDHLPFQPQFANRLKDGDLCGSTVAMIACPTESGLTPFFRIASTNPKGRLGQHLLLAPGGPIEQGAILGHHALEEVDLREDLQQLVELAPSRGSAGGPNRGAAPGPSASARPLPRPWPASRRNPWPTRDIA